MIPTMEEALKQARIAAIRAAMAETRWHRGKAAKLLDISRKSIWEQIRRYGLVEEFRR